MQVISYLEYLNIYSRFVIWILFLLWYNLFSIYENDFLRILRFIHSFMLLQVASDDAELWVCAESLDVLVDIYSDDKTDRLALGNNLVERLKGIKTIFKNKVVNLQFNDVGCILVTLFFRKSLFFEEV